MSLSEKLAPNFLFEMSTGKPVSIEPFHYAIIGQTQFSGKTTLIKRLSEWAVDLGYKILIFDTKETEVDYAGFGQEVPVCLRETTDAFVLIGLLESMFRRRLTPYYATLSRLTESAKGFDGIIARARKAEAETKNSWLRDAYRTLYDLLERLQTETAKVKTVPKLELHEGLNRMVINEFSLEAQQLVMKNSFEDLLRVYRRMAIGVIDEAFKFLPQGYSSAATRAIMNVMTQGAKTGLFGWISTQFLAITDKDPLKACAIKFLGTQDHSTEVKHTLDLIPEARGKISSDDIMKLKLGHWVLVRKRPMYVGVVYALPADVPGELGSRVARGELTPEYVRDQYLKQVLQVQGDTNLDYKEEYEKERQQREQLQGEKSRLEKQLDDAGKAWEEQSSEIQKLRSELEDLKDWRTAVTKEVAEKAEKFDKVRSVLSEILPQPVTTTIQDLGVATPMTVGLQNTTTIVSVPTIEKHVTINTETMRGKILHVAKKGKLNEWRKLGEIVAAVEAEHWNAESDEVNNALTALAKEGLVAKKHKDRNYFCLAQGVIFEKEEEVTK